MNTYDTSDVFHENVVLIDASYADRVAFDLTVNFERMLERRIPPADMALWLDCLALDGGLREGENITDVIFACPSGMQRMDNFRPSSLSDELHGHAFKDRLGEFCLSAYSADDKLTDMGEFFIDLLQVAANHASVKRLLLVADMENYGTLVTDSLRRMSPSDKDITLLSMSPVTGRGFQCEILGYSLMQALGISAAELDTH